MSIESRRFVTAAEKISGHSPWALEEWLCRNDIVSNEHLLLVRVTIDPGRCHAFHTHPHREELIYILSGKAEQWVGRAHQTLAAGDVAFIPAGEVHGTYNPFNQPVSFLAILSPANAPDPALVDVSKQDPWIRMREGLPACT